ncbi:MAG: OmpA family protein [Pseudomonadota bacterium]
MQTRILDILTNEQLLRLSGACADDGRPLAHQVFFDADCWEVPDDFTSFLKCHAHYLLEHPGLVALLSGHSYGTGSQRFFWLMGDRRAHAVRHALVRSGVPARQLRVQSVGEARPSIELGGQELGRYRRRVTIDYVQAGAEDLERIPAPGSPVWWRAVLGAGPIHRLPGHPPPHNAQSSSAASRPGNNTSV